MRSNDVDIRALDTAVGLLDALIDGAAAAVPGVTAALYARDLRRLGDGAALAAEDLASVRPRRRHATRAA